MWTLLILLVGMTIGAYLNHWWRNYLDDTADTRSVQRFEQARRCGNRWL